MDERPEGRKYTNLGLIFAGLSLVVIPIVFGIIGLISGLKGYMDGDERRGALAIVLSVVLATVSAIIGAYFVSQ
ncbi:MAG: hypothetical protein H8Z69_04450 [Nanohaloarchaea archaeon]|nr:hypothetical protein [Candidatus Nanohaloarchaea archaeon]